MTVRPRLSLEMDIAAAVIISIDAEISPDVKRNVPPRNL